MYYIDKYSEIYDDNFYKTLDKIILNDIKNEYYFHNLIIYGNDFFIKRRIINNIIKKIFNIDKLDINHIEYIVPGYVRSKIKISITQSLYHIIIDPISNGHDKYLINDVIQDYIKSDLSNIFKKKIPIKIIIINNADNLSYYVQLLLRQIIDKFNSICKFILFANNLSKIIDTISSRCILVRLSQYSMDFIIDNALNTIHKEQLTISLKKFSKIIYNSANNTELAWNIELFKYNINQYNAIDKIINEIIFILIYPKNKSITNKQLYNIVKSIKTRFYKLFISNISTWLIFKKIMLELIDVFDDINIKYSIIDITSKYEERLSLGTRYIIQFECYIFNLIKLIMS